MIQRLKDVLVVVSGWLAAVAVAVFLWPRRPVKPTPHVEPKHVPEDENAMLDAARDEGLIK